MLSSKLGYAFEGMGGHSIGLSHCFCLQGWQAALEH